MVTLGIRVLKGLAALHRLDIVHRDLKPANLHVDADGKLRILDLGVARCPTLDVREDHAQPGTPSFMAPELFGGAEASVQTDLYAVGATLYHLLTRKYPYGEIEPFQHPRFGEPVPPARYRPDLPPWLENVILKAVARDPGAAFRNRRGNAARPGARRSQSAPASPHAADRALAGGRLAARRRRFDYSQSAVAVFAAGKLKAPKRAPESPDKPRARLIAQGACLPSLIFPT